MIKINLLNSRVTIRKLISLYQDKYGSHPDQWYISFAYYQNDQYSGRLKFNGTHEEAHVSEEKLYQLLKPALKKETRPTRRDLREES